MHSRTVRLGQVHADEHSRCLDIPTYGSYHLNGQPVSDMKPSVLSGIRNREIGFIFQALI